MFKINLLRYQLMFLLPVSLIFNNINIMNYKWLVTFCLPGQGSKMFKEIIEANQWSHAKALLEAKYAGIVIKNHTTIK